MPIRRAASGSCAVARIALPYFVEPTNHSRPTSSGTVMTTAKTSECSIATLKTEK